MTQREHPTFNINEGFVTDLEIFDLGNRTLLEYWIDGTQYTYTFVPEGDRVRAERTVVRSPDEGEGHEPIPVSETNDLSKEEAEQKDE